MVLNLKVIIANKEEAKPQEPVKSKPLDVKSLFSKKPELKPESVTEDEFDFEASTSITSTSNNLTKMDAEDALESILNSDCDLEKELAAEFEAEAQPDRFNTDELFNLGEALKKLESNVDNKDIVKDQMTYIMLELKKNPDMASAMADVDWAIMVKALRHSYKSIASIVDLKKTARVEKKKASSKSNPFADIDLGFDLD